MFVVCCVLCVVFVLLFVVLLFVLFVSCGFMLCVFVCWGDVLGVFLFACVRLLRDCCS